MNLNIKLDTLNLIEEKAWESSECIGTGDNFLYKTHIAQAVSLTINK